MARLVSVVVPFFNEAPNVAPLHEKVRQVFSAMPDIEYECIYVNDGSSDGTRNELERLQSADSHVHPVHLVRNSGQSAALVAGLRRAQGEYLLTLDGDLQNDPGDFPAILEKLKQVDCVCGVRVKRNDTWSRRVASRIANAVRNFILKDGVRDTGCGLKGFRRVCVRHFIPFNGMHRFMPAIIRAAGLTLTECDVTHHARRHGASKYGIGNRLWRGLYDLIGVSWLRKRYVAYEIENDND